MTQLSSTEGGPSRPISRARGDPAKSGHVQDLYGNESHILKRLWKKFNW